MDVKSEKWNNRNLFFCLFILICYLHGMLLYEPPTKHCDVLIIGCHPLSPAINEYTCMSLWSPTATPTGITKSKGGLRKEKQTIHLFPKNYMNIKQSQTNDK